MKLQTLTETYNTKMKSLEPLSKETSIFTYAMNSHLYKHIDNA